MGIFTALKIIYMLVDFGWSSYLLSATITTFRPITFLVDPYPHLHTFIIAARPSIEAFKGVIEIARAFLIIPKMVASSLVA